MREVTAEERKVLYANKNDCYDTTFRQKEIMSVGQWAIFILIVTIVVITVVFVTMFGLDYLGLNYADKVKKKTAESLAKIIAWSFAGLTFGGCSYMFRKQNRKKSMNYFLRRGSLQISGATVVQVQGNRITYLEDEAFDENGKQYLIDYTYENAKKAKRLNPYERILVLYGEDKKGNPVTRIMAMNEEVATKFRSFREVTMAEQNWEEMQHYPDRSIVTISKNKWFPTESERQSMIQDIVKKAKKKQLKLLIPMFFFFTVLAGAISALVYMEEGFDILKILNLFWKIELGIVAFLALIRWLGIRNTKKSIPSLIQLQEVMFVSIEATQRYMLEVCFWDAAEGRFAQRKFVMKNLFFKPGRKGTKYYMASEKEGECFLVDK